MIVWNSEEISDRLAKSELLDFVFNLGYISRNEYKIGLWIRKIYRKQKDLNLSISYDLVKTKGGKYTAENFTELIHHNKEWLEFYRNYNRKDIDFIERYIGEIITFEELHDNDDNIEHIIYELTLLLSKACYDKRKELTLSIVEQRFMLKWLVNTRTIKEVSEDLKINPKTIRKIVNGNNNDFNFRYFDKLVKYFDL